MKNGFTLVELMAVIVLIAIITVIGFVSVTGVQKNINKNLWQSKEELILNGAKHYGEDNKNKLSGSCTVDGVTKNKCIVKTVGELINENYITTDETDASGNKIMINDTLNEDDTNYIVNNMQVKIYLENNMIYASF